MKNNQKFVKNIIPIEIELGFVRVPNRYKNLFPKINSKIKIYLGDARKALVVGYNAKHQRITGLVGFFRSAKAKPKDVLQFEKLDKKKFRLKVEKVSERVKKHTEFTQEEARQIIDAGEISSVIKGNIVEERIAHLIFLYGQGLLNVYKPVADIEGIDLIVVKKGAFQPIFIQVKSRYNLRGNNLQFGIKCKDFNSHHTFYIIGAYFDPQKMDLETFLIFIPSGVFEREVTVINRGRKDARYVLTVPLSAEYSGRYAKYIIRKENLVNKIFEKFSEIEKYLK